MRFRLRTLLIVLALGPPVLAGLHWTVAAWQRLQTVRMAHQTAREAQERLARLEEEMIGHRETVAGMSTAELDQRFAEIVAAVEAGQ